MPEIQKETITPAKALTGESPLVLIALLEPVAGLDRFQPAGFPEVGHVTYKAPREGGAEEDVCIVDSAASMANHLESVCMRGPHDYELVEDLEGMPYLRCVTGPLDNNRVVQEREVIVTSLTEGHRIASTYLLEGHVLSADGRLQEIETEKPSKAAKRGKRTQDGGGTHETFEGRLIKEFGIELAGSSKAHPPVEKWWNVFQTIFRYDPNSLVHGVLFPQWQIKIPRVLTSHIEAFGASRVDRSGVKFDRLGKTTSGQPIFAVDEATAREIRATFILDLALVRSFGRKNGEKTLGLTDKQQEFLVALALWKIQRLLAVAFRYRSGCHLRCKSLRSTGQEVEIEVDIQKAIEAASFSKHVMTDVWWPRDKLYQAGKADEGESTGGTTDDERDDIEQDD